MSIKSKQEREIKKLGNPLYNVTKDYSLKAIERPNGIFVVMPVDAADTSIGDELRNQDGSYVVTQEPSQHINVYHIEAIPFHNWGSLSKPVTGQADTFGRAPAEFVKYATKVPAVVLSVNVDNYQWAVPAKFAPRQGHVMEIREETFLIVAVSSRHEMSQLETVRQK